MGNLIGFPGQLLQTQHIQVKPSGIYHFDFSDDEALMAIIGWYENTGYAIWDNFSDNLIVEKDNTTVEKILFLDDNNRVVSCSETVLEVTDLVDSIRSFRHDLPSDTKFRRVSESSLTSVDSILVVGSGNQLSLFETSPFALSRTLQFTDDPKVLPLFVNGSSNRIQVCYQSEYHSDHRIIAVVEIPENHRHLIIDLSANDLAIPTKHCEFIVVYRGRRDLAEVWRPMEGCIVHELPIRRMWEGVTLGPADRFVAQFCRPESSDSNLVNCHVEIWDVHNGTQASVLEDVPFCDIWWSQNSQVLALTNHVLANDHDAERHMAVFVDPFTGRVLAHAFNHWGFTPEHTAMSPSGRWFVSGFPTDFTTGEGKVIPAGSIAITDLSPILPSKSLTEYSPPRLPGL